MDIRVIVYEDNTDLRLVLYHLIESAEGMTCVGAFADCMQIIRQVADFRPDIILMDIGLPGMSGIEAVRLVREKYPDVKVLMQTIFEDADKIFESILAGASGYMLKNTSSERIIEAIRETLNGGAPMSPAIATKVLKMVVHPPLSPGINHFNLSDREKEVLSYLVRGMSYKMVAETCIISVDTVRAHIRSIYEKLHVHSKGEAIAKAIKGKIV